MDSSRLSTGQLNSSSSKMKYSFPKTNRFDNKRYDTPSPNKFYQLPEIKSKRAAGFGYGNKMDLSKQNVKTPGPDIYKMHSSFDLKASQGITMAPGRDKVKAGDMFQENFKKPSPFEYNPEKPKTNLSYSMSYRNPDLTDRWIKSVPGPGAYSNEKLTNDEIKSLISNYVSAPSTRFGRESRKTEAEIMNPRTPGPNQYNNATEVSKRFSQKKGNKFSNSIRPSMAKQALIPGPGAYERASDFS